MDNSINTKPLHENPWKCERWWVFRHRSDTNVVTPSPQKNPSFRWSVEVNPGAALHDVPLMSLQAAMLGRAWWGGNSTLGYWKVMGRWITSFYLEGFSKLLLYSLTLFTSCSQHKFFFAKHFLVPSNDPTTTCSFGVKTKNRATFQQNSNVCVCVV